MKHEAIRAICSLNSLPIDRYLPLILLAPEIRDTRFLRIIFFKEKKTRIFYSNCAIIFDITLADGSQTANLHEAKTLRRKSTDDCELTCSRVITQ